MGSRSSGSRGLAPFVAGTLVGAAAGLTLGAFLSGHLAHAVAAIVHAADRRGIERDRERLRFDLLLQ
jgi:hypothetical protein